MGEQFSDPNREAVGMPPIRAEGEQTAPRPSKVPKARPPADAEVTPSSVTAEGSAQGQ